VNPSITESTNPPTPVQPLPWGFWATVGWTLLIAVGWMCAQVVAVVVYVVWHMQRDGGKIPATSQITTSGLLISLATILSAPVGIGLAVFFAWLRKTLPLREYFALRWPGVKVAALWILAFLAFLVLSDLVTRLLGKPIVPDVMVEIYRNAGIVPLLWLAIVVAGPLAEETVFRGFIFAGLQASRVGTIGTILLTSAAWSILHIQYDAYGILLIFITGIFLGVVRWKTRSLPLCFLLHATMNLGASLETLYLLRQ
jgi:membrane protease YdiL (CAAX protease family)